MLSVRVEVVAERVPQIVDPFQKVVVAAVVWSTQKVMMFSSEAFWVAPPRQGAASRTAVDERTRRVAENENLFRQVNEHVVAGGRRPAETFEIVCECEDLSCMDHLRVTTEAYQRARREPTDFLLKPGHAKPEFETVIESHEDFELVRKTGAAAVLAKQLDPRS